MKTRIQFTKERKKKAREKKNRWHIVLPDKIYDQLTTELKEKGISFKETTTGKVINKMIKQMTEKYD